MGHSMYKNMTHNLCVEQCQFTVWGGWVEVEEEERGVEEKGRVCGGEEQHGEGGR